MANKLLSGRSRIGHPRRRRTRRPRRRLTRKRSRTFAQILVMNDLYRRLRQAGFDKAFVKRNLLPDWWDDALADVPANRAVAEAAISRMLGFPVAALRNHDQVLEI